MNKLLNTRLEELDISRGIAAILMILGHSFITYPVDVSKVAWCSKIQVFIYEFHMELFFLIAGYVYHCKTYKSFIIKKIKRILIPYIFFGIIVMLLKAYGGAAINGVEPIEYGIKKLFLYGGSYWFLYVSFFVYLLYPYIDKVLNNYKKLVLVGLILTLINVLPFIQLFKISTLLYYSSFFIIGNVLRNKLGGIKYINNFKSFLLLILLYFALKSIEGSFVTNYYIKFFKALPLSLLTINFVKLMQHINKPKFDNLKSLIIKCGEYSLQLYLFNGFLLTGLRIIICNIFGIHSPLIIVFGIWSADIAITLLIVKLIILQSPLLRKVCGI